MDWMSTNDAIFSDVIAQCDRCGNDNLNDGPLCRTCREQDTRVEGERLYWERAAAMADPRCPDCEGRGFVMISDDNGADYAPAFSVQERCECVRAAERAALDAAPPIEEEDEFLAAFMPQAA